MDPKELAKLYAAQMAKEAADRAAEKAADAAATKARESAAADAENALNDVAIPYLKQIKSAMAGNFTFDVQRFRDISKSAGKPWVERDVGLEADTGVQQLRRGVQQCTIGCHDATGALLSAPRRIAAAMPPNGNC